MVASHGDPSSLTPREREVLELLRLGLTDAVKEADDFYGLTVNLAGRIADAAAGGRILVSSVLRDLADGRHEFRFDAARELELWGSAGRHTAYTLRWQRGRPTTTSVPWCHLPGVRSLPGS
jgi:class 3 adenylate cyclase